MNGQKLRLYRSRINSYLAPFGSPGKYTAGKRYIGTIVTDNGDGSSVVRVNSDDGHFDFEFLGNFDILA